MATSLPAPYFTLRLEGQVIQRFALDRPLTSIGRARESEIQISVRGVSRHHAIIVRDDDGRCTVQDLGSANGTYVNGTRIEREHVLQPGDVLNFLDYSLCFHREGVPDQPAPMTGEIPTALESFEGEIPNPPLRGENPSESLPRWSSDSLDPSGPKDSTHPDFDEVIATEEGPIPEPRPDEGWAAEVMDPVFGSARRSLDRPVTTLGGAPDSQIRLSGNRLERWHSLLVTVEDKLLYVRLSAVNIARVNGTARMVAFVQDGDEISVGPSTVKVRKR